jgi:hypothetical protein
VLLALKLEENTVASNTALMASIAPIRWAALLARDRLHRGPGLKSLRRPTEGRTNGVACVRNTAYDQVCGLSAGNPKVTILS